MDFRGLLFMLAAAFLWGIIGIFAKEIMAEGISALEIAFWRAFFAWFAFLVHALATQQWKIRQHDIPIFLGFGFICVTLFYSLYQVAIQEIGMAMAAVLLYTAPAWVALLSWILLKEQMTLTKNVCILMTIIGVSCISLGPTLSTNHAIHLNSYGILAGLGSGFTYALYYIFGKKFLYKYTTPNIFIYALPFGALFLLPFIEFHHKSIYAWSMLCAMGTLTGYGAFSVYYAGHKRMEATQASVIATFEPVIAAIFAYFFFKEQFSLLGYVGSSCIVVAVLFVILAGKKAKNSNTQEI